MPELVLIRHGESDWNHDHLHAGWMDVELTELGQIQARTAAAALETKSFDVLFTSELTRSQHTARIVLKELGQSEDRVEVVRAWQLNERFFGALTGVSGGQAGRVWGHERVRDWYHSYDVAPPGGESLKHVESRAVPFLREKILPCIEAGQNVLVSSHAFTLATLIMDIEGLSHDEAAHLELKNCDVHAYIWVDGSFRLHHRHQAADTLGHPSP